ncbi:tail fiber protein [Methylomonas sp. MO1]|uniref:phage tail protein n=1 Tax=Methylomonas sp. MO1 TaxID=3073619 RepID=UPI0028A500E5|nr:tail fiber protein [Methylomonas sp. MO1]MDT4292121.1 tail fiber protein [Methylomonas sp. MO1]
MADPFLGEIRIFGFAYAPQDWAFCNGQQMAIQQQAALYALLGTRFGGDGRNYFNLPNLQGRAPIHFGANPIPNAAPYQLAQVGGTTGNAVQTQTAFSLTTANLPSHNHSAELSLTGVNAATAIKVSTGAGGGVTPDANATLTNAPNGQSSAAVFLPAATPQTNPITLGGVTTTLSGNGTVAVGNTGAGAPVSAPLNFNVPATMPPYLALNFCIALNGLFPPQQ